MSDAASRTPAPDRSAVAADPRSVAHLRAVVAREDPPHRPRPRAHHERLGGGAPVALVADALEHVAVGHPGGREEHVLAARRGRRRSASSSRSYPAVDRGVPLRRRRAATAGPSSSPPMHLIAAAVITPSGVPPIPHSMSTGELSLTASSAAETSPSGSAGPGRRPRGPRAIASRVALAVEHHDHHVADVALACARRSAPASRPAGRSRSSRSAISGPPAIFSM